MAHVKTPWDDHWMYAEYIAFFHHALGVPAYLSAYRKESGNTWEPAVTPEARMIDKATGADLAFLQGFSDWLVANIFGSPTDVFGDHPIANGETVH